ncbi:hypothetical protein CsatB_004105 [Cannabis sativa]
MELSCKKRKMMKYHKLRKKRKEKNDKICLLDTMLNDDIMVEIFIRLQDCATQFRCSIVCKRWFSIINSNYYRQQQIVRHHSLSQSLSFTFIFRVTNRSVFPEPFCELFYGHDRKRPLLSEGYLNFIPWGDIEILASHQDLLLLGCDRNKFIVICNPFTRQWIELPGLHDPLYDNYYFTYGGLVLCDNEDNQYNQIFHQIRFKVIITWNVIEDLNVDSILKNRVSVFSSETGNWSQITYFTNSYNTHIHPFIVPILTNYGVLHWVDQDSNRGNLVRIVVLDPFKDVNHRRFINFPSDILVGRRSSSRALVQIGLVQGKLRLSHLVITKIDGFVLKIWELDNENHCGDKDDGVWILVHYFEKKEWKGGRMYVIAFHPQDGNIIFLLHRKRYIYRYNIKKKRMKKIGEFKEDRLAKALYTYTLVHPLWPTSIPYLKF